MKYMSKTFQLPAGSTKITQDKWDLAFGLKQPRKIKKGKNGHKPDNANPPAR